MLMPRERRMFMPRGAQARYACRLPARLLLAASFLYFRHFHFSFH
jgi:hypothetical protein